MNDWFHAEHHAEKAQRFYELGQWDEALVELRQALSYNPHQSEWQFGLGLTLDALERFDEAVEAYEQVLRLRGEDIETLLHLGVDLIRSGEAARALPVLERVNALDLDCEPGYCYRIAAYAQLGDHDAAEMMFYRARQVVDQCPACYDHIAHSLLVRGEVEQAIWCWQQTLALDPDYPEVHANLGLAHHRLGQFERARQDYLNQLYEEPDHVRSLLELGELLLDSGRYAEAGEKLRRALEIDPTLAEAHHLLGELALLSGHLEAATSRLERARQLDPDRPGLHLALAQIAKQRGQWAQARQYTAVERRRTGHDAQQVLELAQLMIELEQAEQAIALLTPMLEGRAEPVLTDDDDMATALHCRGIAYMMSGRLEQGIRDCRAVLRFAPDHITAMQNLALACLEAHQLRRARVWMRRAERLEPSSPVLRRLRYRLLRLELIELLKRWRGRAGDDKVTR